jgi:hypothetical protein
MAESFVRDLTEGLEKQPLRPALALATRAVRRVLPLLPPGSLGRHRATIAIAEALASGEPFSLSQAHFVVAEAAEAGDEEEPTSRAAFAAQAARLVARSALSAQELVEGLPKHWMNVPSRPWLKPRHLLSNGMSLALKAAGVDDEGSPDPDRALVTGAVSADMGTLLSSSEPLGLQSWLGPPVDPREDGPLGELWPDGRAPTWYKADDGNALPTVVTGETFANHSEELLEKAEIVCWHLDAHRLHETKVLSVIERSIARSAEAGLAPPAFVVHAPDLHYDDVDVLAAAGVTVLMSEDLRGRDPRTSEALVDVVGSLMRAEYAGWKDEGGYWRYDDPRTLWYSAVTPLSPRSASDVSNRPPAGTSATVLSKAWDPNLEAEEQDPAYGMVVENSKGLRERLESEDGWPSES